MTIALKNGKHKREVIMLGDVHEINDPINFVDMGHEAKGLINQLHLICLKELMSRSVSSVWCWSKRVENIFKNNNIVTIQNLVTITLAEVNNLANCGFKSRREIYDIFLKEYNIKLNQWNPEHHWDKYLIDPITGMRKE